MTKLELIALIRAHWLTFDSEVSERMLAAGYKKAFYHLDSIGKYLNELAKLDGVSV